jgi:hypothetical protein
MTAVEFLMDKLFDPTFDNPKQIEWFEQAKEMEKKQQQDKKLYSEEDIKEAFRQGEDNVIIIDLVNLVKKKSIVEWFEQFKKKA